MSFIQYLKDTRTELNHVAWPTRAQTIVYTVLVVVVSVLVSLYLGLFDFIFTGALSRILSVLPSNPISITQQPVSTTQPTLEFSTSTSATSTDL